MPATESLLRVNGIQPAFGIEVGLASPRADEARATDPYRQANVSYSLVQRQAEKIVRHTLIDCGMGVVPSLLEFEHSHGVHVVHEVVLTHPHFDHFAQLDWLSMCLLRSGRPDQPQPLPIYASQECWDVGPNRVHRYLAERCDFRPLQPGVPIMLGDIILTPFAVDHGPKAPGALGFVTQHGCRKVLITGDFLRVPNEDDPLLLDADAAFLDANTWHPAEHTWHQSVLGNLRLVEKWLPKRTYMIHYSGYEDREQQEDQVSGPLGIERLAEELHRAAGAATSGRPSTAWFWVTASRGRGKITRSAGHHAYCPQGELPVRFRWPALMVVLLAPLGSLGADRGSYRPAQDYEVEAGGKRLFVHAAPVLRDGPASFASFDMSGPVEVTLTVAGKIGAPKVLPASYGIKPTVMGNKDIQVTGPVFPESKLTGFDDAHLIEDVTFEALKIQGKLIGDATAAMLQTNPYVRRVNFLPAARSLPSEPDSR